MDDFRIALSLLTMIPLAPREANISARALAYYPLVGLVIGLVLAAMNLLLRLFFPGLVAAALLIALWAVITGALHLDGFTDACDGLFAATTRERRLEILRDVHLGAFGAVGLALLLITKVATVASIPSFAPIVLAPVLGRWAMVYAAAYPLARRDGMAVKFSAGLTRRELLVATGFAAATAAICGALGLAALAGAFAVATVIARFAVARLGGLTGDIYGMVCESVEVAVLLVGASAIR
jgi:adenosylcobinamide-GDP ribazoletransferase